MAPSRLRRRGYVRPEAVRKCCAVRPPPQCCFAKCLYSAGSIRQVTKPPLCCERAVTMRHSEGAMS